MSLLLPSIMQLMFRQIFSDLYYQCRYKDVESLGRSGDEEQPEAEERLALVNVTWLPKTRPFYSWRS